GLGPIQYLHQRRPGRAHCISGETVDREPRTMAEDAPQGDLLVLREVVFWHLPFFQPPVHVLVQFVFCECFQWSKRKASELLLPKVPTSAMPERKFCAPKPSE